MSGEYRDRARECWRLASEVTDPAQRALLTEMAQAWMRLDDQALRNAKLDLTYETPARREPVVQQQQQQQQQPPSGTDEPDA